MEKGKKLDIDAIIKKAVNAGIQAGRVQGTKTAGDTYKLTEKRLYAYPVLVERIDDTRGTMNEYVEIGVPEHSNSISRFSRSGVRLSSDEILDALMIDLGARIARDQHEVDTIDRALKTIENDAYFEVITGRYINEWDDEDIADDLQCDPSTVRRNRSRLIRRLATWLYGAEAIPS